MNHQSLQYIFTQRDLNLKQHRWLELLKDYDITILYHLRKANMVVDALSRKISSIGSLLVISVEERPLVRDVKRLANSLILLQIYEETGGLIAFIEAHFSLVEQIWKFQFNDEMLCLIRDKMMRGEAKEVILDSDGILRIRDKICVPKVVG
ncbi:hypothetical protein MTR67_019077 [Solanum verrucosum]|uniref:Uncharacterized protein n=1 Tax=Solanum verrucosum TaxID=315347 RepID=A0AAF0QKV4_SOLVR|nr:hypothetical protein MTR67_019077 [Solanum verrucosum]